MAKSLIIVESPAKTKTLKNFLGPGYEIEASFGHVRDLPEKVLGVDVKKEFKPTYQVVKDRKDIVTKLKKKAEGATNIYIATDPDREGEAIAWHLVEALKIEKPLRIEFNEITKTAVTRAIENPRTIDTNRVNAQQTRRILDRLVGYQVSPLLWSKLSRKNLSAGRVQSVAVKLIVDREREIRNFTPVEYWSLTAELTPVKEKFPFSADLKQKNGAKVELPNSEIVDAIISDLDSAEYRVKAVTTKEKKLTSPLPFITSTIQQEAARKLNFNAKHTMRVAQQLYEGIELGKEGSVGLITYMRTDSVRIADEAKEAAKKYIKTKFGAEFVNKKEKVSKKNARVQDAHEAIRPTDVFREPKTIAEFLDNDQKRLYELIWNRFVASQMSEAIYDVTSVDIIAKRDDKNAASYLFRASGSVPKFKGWQAVYSEGKDTAQVEEEEKPPLPTMTSDELLKLLKLLPGQHFTEPPPRYTEATLVRALEQNGVGRPSTYASILDTIRTRKYVEMKQKKFMPTDLGEVVNDYLVEKFPDIVDVKFTATLEDELDKIEEAEMEWVQVLKEFYEPFSGRISDAKEDKEKIVMPTGKMCPNCGKDMVIKTAKRGGEFYACTGYPDCKTTMPMGLTEVKCPLCKEGDVLERRTKKGYIFYGCNKYPDCKFASWNKPLAESCPLCQSYLVEAKVGFRGKGKATIIKCSNEECKFTKQPEKKPEEEGE